jgi:hypothetical protein
MVPFSTNISLSLVTEILRGAERSAEMVVVPDENLTNAEACDDDGVLCCDEETYGTVTNDGLRSKIDDITIPRCIRTELWVIMRNS